MLGVHRINRGHVKESHSTAFSCGVSRNISPLFLRCKQLPRSAKGVTSRYRFVSGQDATKRVRTIR